MSCTVVNSQVKQVFMKKRSKTKELKALAAIKDQYIGEEGSSNRNLYEFELKLELIGEMIKTMRKERNLTQEALGKLVGVKKAQISKIEKGTNNVTINTLVKVFSALNIKMNLQIELLNNQPYQT